MVLCINSFARAELIAPNNIGHAVQVSTVKGSSRNPINRVKIAKDNNEDKLNMTVQLFQTRYDSKHQLVPLPRTTCRIGTVCPAVISCSAFKCFVAVNVYTDAIGWQEEFICFNARYILFSLMKCHLFGFLYMEINNIYQLRDEKYKLK